MNEPKKRGRPTNAERAAKNAAVEGSDVTVPVINGDKTHSMDEAVERAKILLAPLGEVVHYEPIATSLAQTYALRVWRGQSESADRAWRVQRVKDALAGQGLSFEGVELPNG